MEWICSVTFTPSGFCLKTIDGNQAEHVRPVSELQSVLASDGGKVTKIRSNTSFADWRELSTEEIDDLAGELGFPSGCNGQTFYEFEADGQRYVIPAGVLMCAMFRPFHGIAKYLFAPQGLDNFCMPYGNSEKPELMFFMHLRATTGIQADKAQGILNSLSWMHCFPSAKQMWFSVLKRASLQRLELSLPIGEINFTGAGKHISSGTILIHEVRIYRLVSYEEPFESFSLHSHVIEFERSRENRKPPKKPTYPKDDTIPLLNGNWQITDEEWTALEKIVVLDPRPGVAVRARRILNLILQKFSQGVAWSTVTAERLEQIKCTQFLRRMKSDDRWSNVIAKLTELRCTI